jgi:hypothetical protein
VIIEQGAKTKTCTKCNNTTSVTNFAKDSSKSDGLYSSCKVCSSSYKKDYHKRNRSKIVAKVSSWQRENWQKTMSYKRKYRRSERGLSKMRSYKKAHPEYRKAKTIEERLKRNLRNRICKVKNLTKFRFKTFELLGYDVRQLKARIEFNFVPGMTWENHGKIWHIDHKKPLSHFDYSDLNQVKLSWMLCNIQPLWAEDNMRKGNRWLG